jgi:hypothetical protein
MKKKRIKKTGFWHNVPPIHKKRIINSYKESFNPENWIDHEEAKKQHKWLLKPINPENKNNKHIFKYS